jgi:hypothetical protein
MVALKYGKVHNSVKSFDSVKGCPIIILKLKILDTIFRLYNIFVSYETGIIITRSFAYSLY